MNTSRHLIAAALAALLFTGGAYAQTPDRDDKDSPKTT